jgi:predicted transcriptional regulator
MTAVSVRLPDDVANRLNQLAALTGRSKSFYITEAILERKWSVILAWQIELDDAAKKDLAKLDKPVAKRITAFIRERLAVLDDRAASVMPTRVRA